jgi:hypothetical protein
LAYQPSLESLRYMKTVVGQSIDFRGGGNAVPHLMHGWCEQEPTHTWSSGPEGAVFLDVPNAPFGYFLEIDWYPFVVLPLLDAQPVTVTVNGTRVFSGDVRADEVSAYFCPAPAPGEPHLVISFFYPCAARPLDFGAADYRELALAFRRLRLLPLAEPRASSVNRISKRQLESSDLVGLAAEVESATGQPISALLTQFEMICGNCDMGLVQRAFGLEPLSLLRFAGTYPSVSIRGLDTRFDGIGVDLEPWQAGHEWMMRDHYGLSYHTGQLVGAVTPERLIGMEQRRIRFLLDKLLVDLSDGDKIFVADRVATSLHGVLALFLALRRHGKLQMLWLTPTPHRSGGGEVCEVYPGLFVGNIYQFSRPTIEHVSVRGWLEVMINAWLLMQQGS